MAFIRKRTTKNGVVSTALVEAYRDGGKPRHRIIANLRGAESLTVALGRLAAERDKLRKERDGLDLDDAAKFYEIITTKTMAGRVWTHEERKEIDPLMRKRNRVVRRAEQIDTRLARIQREGAAIKKHCTATADEIRAEADKHAKKFSDREAMELGMKMMMFQGIEQIMGET